MRPTDLLRHDIELTCTDADWSTTTIERFYKKDLEAQVGNLASRITTPKVLKKLESPGLLWTMPSTVEEEDKKLLDLLQALPGTLVQQSALIRPAHLKRLN